MGEYTIDGDAIFLDGELIFDGLTRRPAEIILGLLTQISALESRQKGKTMEAKDIPGSVELTELEALEKQVADNDSLIRNLKRKISELEYEFDDAEIRYYEGLREGVRRFAWWKDGVQYVGTTGMTLRDALAEIDALERKARGLSKAERE